jgi:glycosyltransferase involved in cell wall biosynthesis
MRSYNFNKPFISIVVPAYNEEKLLPKCLEALKNQVFNQPYEIIVVDNDSSDETANIAGKAGVIVAFEKNKGIGNARQKGIDIARAEIIAQTDADSVPVKNWLSEIFSVMNSNKDIIGVSGPSYCVLQNGQLKLRLMDNIFNALAFRITPLITGNRAFRGHNVAFRRKSLLEIGGYRNNIKYLDDADLNIRLRKFGKLLFNPRQIVYTSPRRGEKVGFIRVLFFQIWCTFKILFNKNAVITAEDIR